MQHPNSFKFSDMEGLVSKLSRTAWRSSISKPVNTTRFVSIQCNAWVHQSSIIMAVISIAITTTIITSILITILIWVP